ncbi:MAG: hypothetical protein JRG68_07120 [Deltaproteobacteria bacterium]|nr:hypothetical protein [Deltaproteobacteria bacterium]MBW2011283.1 hypothetical protein [Deltaproteobacteria bacterium]MBW2100516.1 hypothetical protein [Deltaproteobacteria bacterium]
MKCIDAIEGVTKSIIIGLYQDFIENRLDDTEYIRNIKAVITQTDLFVNENREIILNDPKMVKKILYSFAKKLWLENHMKESASSDDKSGSDNIKYYEYYYDHIYQQGTYPR